MSSVPPPLSPATKPTSTHPAPKDMPVIVGAAGTVAGVPVTWFEAGPNPLEFSARIRTSYGLPLINPEITKGDAVTTLIGENQVAPPFVENW